jgi:phospholipid transport system substrate-binding protein
VIALMRDKIGKPVELNQDESYDIDGASEWAFFR